MLQFTGASQPRALRVMLVEDDPQIAAFLRLGLEYEGCQIAVVTTGVEAGSASQFDAVILDADANGLAASDLTREVRAQAGDAALLVLLTRDDVDERVAALEAGADDVMTKPLAFAELLARLRAILRRQCHSAAEAVLAFDDITLNPQTRSVTRHGHTIDLTPREFALLALFLRHPRQVLTREVILARVWGIGYVGDPNAIDVYIHSLRTKLEDCPPRLIQTARGLGYVLRGSREQADARDVLPPAVCATRSTGTDATRRRGQRSLRSVAALSAPLAVRVSTC